MSFFALKTIALLSMLWDHLTYVWPVSLTLEMIFRSEERRVGKECRL